MWSLGCILGEMLVGSPLFPGTSTLDQIERIMAGLPKPSREDLASVKSPYSSTILEKASISKYVLITVLLSTMKLNHFESCRNRRPLDQLLTKADTSAVDLMYRMLHYNPHKRITAMEALKHPYVRR
ncbi:mitogen-activated protein kinase 15 [Paragonimus westermani]|uniref:Mitogen-activated protein kinase 15 n=1 Tax=Paragonimus westermani TaxID=34504 RepID=A0A5J4NJK0_9TREM|nr:mitogen-activated protein kinase 15 [Paragonimus westermani]